MENHFVLDAFTVILKSLVISSIAMLQDSVNCEVLIPKSIKMERIHSAITEHDAG